MRSSLGSRWLAWFFFGAWEISMSSLWSVAGIAAFAFVLSGEIGSAPAAEKIDPSGTWTWFRELEGQEAQSVLTLTYKDGKLTGSYKRMGRVVPIANGKLDNNEVSFDADGSWNDQKIHGKFKGKLSHDTKHGTDEINGSIEIVIVDGSLPLAWVARRGIDADDIVGIWKLKFVTPNGNTAEPQLKLTADAGSLKGTYTSNRFGNHEAKDIKLDGSSLSWTVEFERDGTTVKGIYKGQLEAGAAPGTIKGTLALEANGKTTSLEFTGERNGAKTLAAQKNEVKREARKPPIDTKPQARPAGNKSTNLPTAPAKGRVIVMLKSRSGILVVYSSTNHEQGPRFSLRSTEGQEVASDVSLKDLQASYPQIDQVYRTSFARLSAEREQRPAPSGAIEPSRKTLSSAILNQGVDFDLR
jgi:hypothetical protein